MSLENAVEFDHDENLLRSPENVSCLTEFLALLTLKNLEEEQKQQEKFRHLHERLEQLKMEVDMLDANSPEYYTQKEELIFKVVCEIKGIDHEKWLQVEQGLWDSSSFGSFFEDEFVCD
ncbi:hypothetical protein KR009_000896 [Drosophila setifemur]|nr:hypothetical protein KR009_000896 [Drosophila setifemur]